MGVSEIKLDILAFGAHPDDVELSASGTMALEQSLGKKTGIVDLTLGELGTRGSAELRKTEAQNAAKILNLSVRENAELADGFFQADKASLLKVASYIRRFRPEIVLANAPHDRHPDHGRASELVRQASFLAALPKVEIFDAQNKLLPAWRIKNLYYYIQYYTLEADFYVDISNFLDIKIASIRAYSSQFYNPDSKEPETPIASKAFFDSLSGRATDWGRLIGVQYAEAFVTERKPAVRSLFDLV
jgi:N-acetylglucosamine malate deacetylase 1